MAKNISQKIPLLDVIKIDQYLCENQDVRNDAIDMYTFSRIVNAPEEEYNKASKEYLNG